MPYPEFVEAADVKFLEIVELAVDGQKTLLVKGLIFHSALAVKDIETKREGQTTLVLVRLSPTKKGLSGAFEFKIPIDASHPVVLFGPARSQIWPSARP